MQEVVGEHPLSNADPEPIVLSPRSNLPRHVVVIANDPQRGGTAGPVYGRSIEFWSDNFRVGGGPVRWENCEHADREEPFSAAA